MLRDRLNIDLPGPGDARAPRGAPQRDDVVPVESFFRFRFRAEKSECPKLLQPALDIVVGHLREISVLRSQHASGLLVLCDHRVQKLSLFGSASGRRTAERRSEPPSDDAPPWLRPRHVA